MASKFNTYCTSYNSCHKYGHNSCVTSIEATIKHLKLLPIFSFSFLYYYGLLLLSLQLAVGKKSVGINGITRNFCFLSAKDGESAKGSNRIFDL